MSDPQGPVQTDPISAALAPFRKKLTVIAQFYWQMAWHPREFAEEHMRFPKSDSVTKAAKHMAAIFAAWAGGFSLFGQYADLVGQNMGNSIVGVFSKSVVLLAAIALAAIPMVFIFWLVARWRKVTLSQSLLLFMNFFNLCYGAMLVLLLLMGIITFPLAAIDYLYWPPPHPNPTFLSPVVMFVVLSPFLVAEMYMFFRVLLVVPANLAGAMIGLDYWSGFWRFWVSFLIGAIPYYLITSPILEYLSAQK